MSNEKPAYDAERHRFLEEVMHLAMKVWDGELAEIRLMKNRNGASVFSTERMYHSVKLIK